MSSVNSSPVVRFAPSPTGVLHIGSLRTAIFNWLFARRHGGRYLVRIEDTDRARSTPEAVEAILRGLATFGLSPPETPLMQSSRLQDHRKAAYGLLEHGKAYRCYATQTELENMRARCRRGETPRPYMDLWRERSPREAPEGTAWVVRAKMPRGEGFMEVADRIQGTIRVPNEQLDDFVLLRSDGTPTYMLSVVVDDRDMGVTHVIRGADHLTNAVRQACLFRLLDAAVPEFAHIPLTLSDTGGKLSKRQGALGVEDYLSQGFLPQALVQHLMHLGWSPPGHPDDETLLSLEEAAKLFDIDQVVPSPARFDQDKLLHRNAQWIRAFSLEQLEHALRPRACARLGKTSDDLATHQGWRCFRRALSFLRLRAQTLEELLDVGDFLLSPPTPFDHAGQELPPKVWDDLGQTLRALTPWDGREAFAQLRSTAEKHGLKIGALAKPMRLALTGRPASPGDLHQVMDALGQAETLRRMGLGTDHH